MDALQHHREAERLAGLIEEAVGPHGRLEVAETIALAQLHATIALTGVTALSKLGNVPSEDARAWLRMASIAGPDLEP